MQHTWEQAEWSGRPPGTIYGLSKSGKGAENCPRLSKRDPIWGWDIDMNTMPRRKRSDAGFTLIDMLFVVALIGLLASMAIPGLMKARGAAQASSAIGSMRVVNSGELSVAITCGLGF